VFAKLFFFPIYALNQDQMTNNNGMGCLYLNVYILFYYICAELAQKFAPKEELIFGSAQRASNTLS
jgi:hypothetical protein